MKELEKCIFQKHSAGVEDLIDQLEDLLEEDPEEESDEELEEDPEEDLEEESDEELEEDPEEENPDEKMGEKQLEETIFDPEIDNNMGDGSGNDTPVLSRASFYQSRKKCKQEGLRRSKLKLEPSHVDLNNENLISMAHIDNCASKEESAGSSGKRRRSRWEPQPDEDGIKIDDQICKRRRTRWSSDDTQVKILGPLRLADFTEDFVLGSDKDSKIRGLKAELLEINRKLVRPLDDSPEEERSPSPEPMYNNLGIRINTREARLRQLVQKRQTIISKLIKLSPTFDPPPDYKPSNFSKKLYIPEKEYPDYNFVGLIIGPRGNTQKRMENETGAKILLRGKRSSKTPSKPVSEKEDLHVLIEADNQKSLDAAVSMVEKLLIPVEEGRNEHKRAQLKELAVLNGTVRGENLCPVCGDQGHQRFACPNLQSTFKMDSVDSCKSDFAQGSGFSIYSMQNRQAKPGKEISDKHLYVGYLPQSIDDNRLTELFSPFGKITEANVVKDRTTGISKGYGFVKFEDSMDASLAMAHLNGFKMDGKYLKVSIAGLLSNTESPSLSIYSQNPGLAVVSPNVTSRKVLQNDLSGPLHFMLPEHHTSFHDNSDTRMF